MAHRYRLTFGGRSQLSSLKEEKETEFEPNHLLAAMPLATTAPAQTINPMGSGINVDALKTAKKTRKPRGSKVVSSSTSVPVTSVPNIQVAQDKDKEKEEKPKNDRQKILQEIHNSLTPKVPRTKNK